jgi:hypothetical protein
MTYRQSVITPGITDKYRRGLPRAHHSPGAGLLAPARMGNREAQRAGLKLKTTFNSQNSIA